VCYDWLVIFVFGFDCGDCVFDEFVVVLLCEDLFVVRFLVVVGGLVGLWVCVG